MLISVSCLVIGMIYRLRPAYSYLFSAFCIIQPEFLFIHARGGYNLAIAQAWFLAAVATFLLLAHRASLKNFLLNFFTVLFLLTTSFAFPILAYLLFVIIFLIFHVKMPLRYTSLVIVALANFLALLCIIPLYSEYIYNSDLHNRFFSFSNWFNFTVFPWSSEILNFIPTYFDFVSWDGYQFFVFPFAFSTIFVPIAFFNRRFLTFYRGNLEIRFCVCLILAYFICSQMPAYVGPLRNPVRFLPFFAFAICLATSFTLEYAERKKSSLYRYLGFVLICFFLSISKSAGQEKIFLHLQIISAVLLIFIYFIDKIKLKNSFIYPIFAIFVLLILLADTKFTKIEIEVPAQLPRKIEFPTDFNYDGYVFTLGKLNNFPKPFFTSLYLSRSGLYNTIKTVNGYTPLGYKNWYKTMGGKALGDQTAKAEQILDAMLVPLDGANMCRANAWRISTFVFPKDIPPKYLEMLKRCGYHIGTDPSASPRAYASLPLEKTRGWDKLPPVSFPPLEGIVHERHEDAFDRLSLPARDTPVQLVFPRLYWHGFRGAFNGQRLMVTPDESGLLISVTVPAGPAGTLELSFFPETWRYMWISPALGLLGLICVGLYVRRRRPQGFWTPALPR